jgi:hypothetical protein
MSAQPHCPKSAVFERDNQRRALLEYLQELEASDPANQDEKRRAECRAAELRKMVLK